MNLKYEPASVPQHIFVNWLFLGGTSVAIPRRVLDQQETAGVCSTQGEQQGERDQLLVAKRRHVPERLAPPPANRRGAAASRPASR